ncbi:RNA polymerase sigma factor [Polaribacter sp. IC073]|uniref:RNA polymerase sigma factor n=1 Tax=Polaribacter sp. IC073 TaxID=2508540 RepID=UPI0011BF2E25|nr:RNA polymerase sigma-70 factor [Polaribacter sp. IC073]TXD46745.1 RNA polymerase sigma-70 factor [Polaribacter sp. IC073]
MLQTDINNALLKRIANNDVKAFEEVYDKFASRMLVYALNILDNKQVCEDLIQNIFIAFWSKRKKNDINNLDAYLFRAVKFQVFKHFRDNKFPDKDLTRLNFINVAVSSENTLEYAELENAIQTSVSKLPTRCKEIFELSRYEHKTHKEIAETLGISVQAVKNQVSKALSSIKNNLDKEEYLLFFTLFFIANF